MNRQWRLGSGIVLLILGGVVGVGSSLTTGSRPEHWPWIAGGALLVLGTGLMLSGRVAERRRQRRPRTSRRTPDTQSGWVTMGEGILLDDGRTKNLTHGSIPPQPSTGTLPMAIDMVGLGGHREVEGAETWVWSAVEDAAVETWVWTAPDVAVVSQTDEPITCRVWLVVEVDGDGSTRDLPLVPNDIITVEPGRPAHESLTFRLRLIFLNDDIRLDPQGCPRELVFMEIGGRERQRRVSFRPTPHRRGWARLVSFWRRQPRAPQRSTVSVH